MKSTIERSEVQSIEAEIGVTQARLETLNERRGELVFLVRRDPAREQELEHVRGEFGQTQAQLEELRLALGPARAQDREKLKARRGELIEQLAAMLGRLERETEKLIRKARREEDHEVAAQAHTTGRIAYGLACDLRDWTGQRVQFGRQWDILQRLGDMAPHVSPYERIPVDAIPYRELAQELRAIDSQLATAKGGVTR